MGEEALETVQTDIQERRPLDSQVDPEELQHQMAAAVVARQPFMDKVVLADQGSTDHPHTERLVQHHRPVLTVQAVAVVAELPQAEFLLRPGQTVVRVWMVTV